MLFYVVKSIFPSQTGIKHLTKCAGISEPKWKSMGKRVEIQCELERSEFYFETLFAGVYKVFERAFVHFSLLIFSLNFTFLPFIVTREQLHSIGFIQYENDQFVYRLE